MFGCVTQTFFVVVCRTYEGGVETRGTQQQVTKRGCHEPRIVRDNLSQEQSSSGMVGLERWNADWIGIERSVIMLVSEAHFHARRTTFDDLCQRILL